jgi:hypothetical protein
VWGVGVHETSMAGHRHSNQKEPNCQGVVGKSTCWWIWTKVWALLKAHSMGDQAADAGGGAWYRAVQTSHTSSGASKQRMQHLAVTMTQACVCSLWRFVVVFDMRVVRVGIPNGWLWRQNPKRYKTQRLYLTLTSWVRSLCVSTWRC